MIQDDVDDFGMIQKMLDDLEKTSPYLSPHSLKLECRPSPGTHPTAFATAFQKIQKMLDDLDGFRLQLMIWKMLDDLGDLK